MTIWLSGEVFADVGDAYRVASLAIESAVNAALVGRSYGSGITRWALISIILPREMGFKEVRRYHAQERRVEFRLKIDHAAFKRSNPVEQQRLVFECVERSISMLSFLEVPDFDTKQFQQDLAQVII